MHCFTGVPNLCKRPKLWNTVRSRNLGIFFKLIKKKVGTSYDQRCKPNIKLCIWYMMAAKTVNTRACKSMNTWCSGWEVALRGCVEQKSLETPTVGVVTGLCSYHLKQKQQCRTNQRFGTGAWSQYGDERFQLEGWWWLTSSLPEVTAEWMGDYLTWWYGCHLQEKNNFWDCT